MKDKTMAKAIAEQGGGLLDALLDAQKNERCLSETALARIAGDWGLTPAQLYDTASFYSMIRFAPTGKRVIGICRNAPCHVSGAAETIAAFEKELGISMGGTTADGRYTLEYIECIGQCQDSPAVLVDGQLYTGVTAESVPELLWSLA